MTRASTDVEQLAGKIFNELRDRGPLSTPQLAAEFLMTDDEHDLLYSALDKIEGSCWAEWWPVSEELPDVPKAMTPDVPHDDRVYGLPLIVEREPVRTFRERVGY